MFLLIEIIVCVMADPIMPGQKINSKG